MEHLCGVWGAGEQSGVGVQGGKAEGGQIRREWIGGMG